MDKSKRKFGSNKKSPNTAKSSQRQNDIGIFITISIVFIVLTLTLGGSIIEDQRFLHEGRETAAQVIGCSPEKSKYGSYASVSYSYTVEDQVYNNRTAFDGRRCSEIPAGDHLTAIYLVTDPGWSRVIENQDSPIDHALMRVLLLGGWFLLFNSLRSLLRTLRKSSV